MISKFPSSFKFSFVILARFASLALELPTQLLLELPRPRPAPEGAAGGPGSACWWAEWQNQGRLQEAR